MSRIFTSFFLSASSATMAYMSFNCDIQRPSDIVEAKTSIPNESIQKSKNSLAAEANIKRRTNKGEVKKVTQRMTNNCVGSNKTPIPESQKNEVSPHMSPQAKPKQGQLKLVYQRSKTENCGTKNNSFEVRVSSDNWRRAKNQKCKKQGGKNLYK